VTPEDAAATVTLLRAPAAIAAAAFLVGVLSATVSWLRRAPETWAGVALWVVAVALVCLPFLLPTAWYRARPRTMVLWLTAAALVASVRGAILCASLYPLQAPGTWLTIAGLEVAAGVTLWMAVFAVRWRPIADP
jgi:hypothetical protein